MGKEKVKHHGLAHLALVVILFLLVVVVFGGWSEGPLTSGLLLGAKAYSFITGTAGGDFASAGVAGTGLLQLIILFIVNLVIYYIIAAALIFLYNLLFGGKKT